MSTDDPLLLSQPPILTIHTPRLTLQTLQMSDLDSLLPIMHDKEVMKWTSTGPVTTPSTAKIWLSTRCLGAGVFQFAVRLREETEPDAGETPGEKQVIGLLGSFHRPKCGYLFHPGFHGKGYATEAFRAFIEAYFAEVPSPRAGSEDPGAYDYLEAWTDAENWASRRVLEKCGFRKGKVFEKEFEAPSMGLRSSVVWHLARPGMTLEEVGIGEDAVLRGEGDEDGFVPPVK